MSNRYSLSDFIFDFEGEGGFRLGSRISALVAVLVLMGLGLGSGVQAQPTVTDLRPETGMAGDTLRIYGSGFSSTNSENEIDVGNSTGLTPNSASATFLRVEIGASPGSGPVDVFVDNTADGSGAARAPEQFTVVTGGTGYFPVDDTVSTRASGARAVATGDLDGDGDQDVLAGSEKDDALRWYENTGGGVFGSGNKINGSTDLKNPRDVAIADMDGDGDLDAIVARGQDEADNSSDDIVTWYENDGSGGFDTKHTVASNSNRNVDDPRSIAVADINDDGDQDVVVASSDNSTVYWYENDGTEEFPEYEISSAPGNPVTVAVADLDGNETLDVIWGDVSNDEVAWHSNDGTGTFGSAVTIKSYGSDTNPIDVQGGQIDGAGGAEVVVGLDKVDQVAWYDSTDTGWTENSITTNVDSVTAAYLADVNGDGDQDILAASGRSDSLSTFINQGSGSFAFGRTFERSADRPEDLTAADLDGDGKLDPVAASFNDNTVSFYPNLPNPSTIYVDEDAAGNGNPNYGTSWEKALPSLQDGLALAEAGDQIWIAGGTYYPDEGSDPNLTEGKRDTSFTITGAKDGLEIYGGFGGTDGAGGGDQETMVSQRDTTDHPVTLSGDVDGDGTLSGNSYHVLFFDGRAVTDGAITTATRLDGVTVTNGNGIGNAPNDRGGGLLCDGGSAECSPTLATITFAGNSATSGGAIYNDGAGSSSTSSPVITDATFVGNSSGGNGGAMQNRGGSSGTSNPEITNSLFKNNTATGFGGGIYNSAQSGTSSAVIDSVVFESNSAAEDGGAIYNSESTPEITRSFFLKNTAGTSTGGSGGAIHNSSSDPRLVNSVLAGNEALGSTSGDGGAIYNGNSSPLVINTVFVHNEAGDDGGAMTNSVGSAETSSPNVVNATFATNVAADEGGAIRNIGSATVEPEFANTIFWGNSAANSGDEIYNASGHVTTLSHTVVADTAIFNGGSLSTTDTLQRDPQLSTSSTLAGPDGLLATDDDSVNVAMGSPALDAGDNTPFESGGVAETVATDITGASRIQDRNGDETATVNIGAYEQGQVQAPTIASVLPLETYAGHPVRLTGSNFLQVSDVTYNGVSVDYTVVSSDTIYARVPAGASTDASFSVSNSAGTSDPTNTPTTTLARNGRGPYGPESALFFGDPFEATQPYVATVGADSLGLASESFSIDLWFNVENLLSDRTLVGMDGATTDETLNLVVTSGGNLRFGFGGGNNVQTAGGPVTTDTWHHAAFVYDAGSNSRRIYLNGEQVAADNPSTNFQGTSTVFVGRWNSGNYYYGGIDQVRVWQDVLSTDSIRTKMHRTVAPSDASASKREGAYRLDAPVTDTTFDHSSNYRHGILRGSNQAQWVFSGARVGQESKLEVSDTDNLATTVGEEGGSLTVSEVAAEDTVQLYRYGNTFTPRTDSDPGERIPDPDVSDPKRSSLTLGVDTIGTPSTTLTIDYGVVELLQSSPDTVLIRRDGPGQPWQNATGWTHNPSSSTFTKTGEVEPGQYSIRGRPIQDQLYVDKDANGNNDGTSWDDAYETLQDALQAATSANEIWIAESVYRTTGQYTSFRIPEEKDGLELYGGFEGTESTRSARDPSEHATILSGDYGGDDEDPDGDGIIEDVSHIRNDNANHVLYVEGSPTKGTNITSRTVVDGVIVTGGDADDTDISEERHGGGLYCRGEGSENECSPTLRNVTFIGNNAIGRGGAIYNLGRNGKSNPVIVDAVFANNEAGVGGAIYNYGEFGVSSPTITNTVFVENVADPNNGGAIANYAPDGTSTPSITNATFVGNSAANNGGAIFNGAGETSAPVEPKITNTILWGNTASSGGQVYNQSATSTITYSLLEGGLSAVGGDAASGSNNLDRKPYLEYAPLPAGDDGTFATDDDGLHLTPESPAIDAGINDSIAVTTDLTGASRTQNGTVDIGAYEGGRDEARTIYVDSSNTSPSAPIDGTSWAAADTILQDTTHFQHGALGYATGNDEIWVAEGTYTPRRAQDSSYTITGVQDSLEVYGGFNGDESNRSNRNPGKYVTVLSGDVGGNDADSDGDGVNEEDSDIQGTNSPHVLYLDGSTDGPITASTRIDGVVVTGGQGTRGSGLYCQADNGACSPILARIVFAGNVASDDGGAIYNNAINGGISSPKIVSSLFVDNKAGDDGGAMLNEDGADPMIVNVVFARNRATGGSNNYGGAIYNSGGSPTITNVTFSDNQADAGAGALYNAGNSSPTVTNTILWGNEGNEVGNGSSATPAFAHSIVEGSGGSSSWTGPGTDNGGNLDVNPQFNASTPLGGPDDRLATVDDSLNVAPGSPVLDAGDNTPFASGGIAENDTTDITGAPRRQDLDEDGTSTVNIGAYETPAAAAPQVVTEAPSNPTGSGFTAEGTVNPGGLETMVRFRYGRDTDFGPDSTFTVSASPLNGFVQKSVSATPDTLRPNTTYNYFVEASNDSTQIPVRGDTLTVTTTTAAPSGSALAATGVEDSSATLNASVNPGGATTRVYFDLENTATGDSSIYAADTIRTELLSDSTVSLSTPDTLKSATDYEYTVSAANSADSTTLGSASFTTKNLPLTAAADTATTDEDQAAWIQVLANDTDPEGAIDSSSVEVVTAPTTGTVDTVDAATGAIRYVPAPDSNGTDRFAYAVADAAGARDTASVLVEVAPVNDPPLARADTAQVLEGRSVAVDVLSNDADLEGRLDSSSVSVASGPARGNGTAAGGAVAYDPASGYSGPDSLRYRVSDRVGDPSAEAVKADTATVRLRVIEVTLSSGRDTARAGAARVGQESRPATIRLRNEGEAPLSGLQARLEGPESGDFQIESGFGDETDSLGVGEEQAVTVRMTPSETGERRARLAVTTEEGGSDTTQVIGRGVELSVEEPAARRGEAAEIAIVARGIGGGFAPSTDTLYARRGGEGPYQGLPLSEAEGEEDELRLTGTVPPGLVTRRGVEYYAELVTEGADGQSGDTLRVPAEGRGYLEVRFDSLRAPVAMRPEDYRMVTVPVALEGGTKAALRRAYGPYDRTAWRALRWASSGEGDGSYREYPAIDSLQAGEAFWLVTAEGEPPTFGSGQTSKAEEARRIPLSAGWTQVGSPFGYGVRWPEVMEASGLEGAQIDGPVAYRPGQGYRRGPQVLKPWRGYFVFSAEADTLVVPAESAPTADEQAREEDKAQEEALKSASDALAGSRLAPGSWEQRETEPTGTAPRGTAPTGTAPRGTESASGPAGMEGEPANAGPSSTAGEAPNADGARNAGDAPTAAGVAATSAGRSKSSAEHGVGEKRPYTTRVSVWRGGEQAGRVWLGLREGAKAGRDGLDFAQAPPIGGGLRLWAEEEVAGRVVPHAGSFKPAVGEARAGGSSRGEGRTWELAVANRAEGTREARLRLKTEGALPEGMGRYVLDLSKERRVARGQRLELEGRETRRLKVIVGTEAFAKRKSEGIELNTFKNELRGNYPNPFGEQTRVAYTLARKQEVTIEIYNVLGQRVRTLVSEKSQAAGLHEAEWEGRSRYGRPVGSGVYFCRIRATGFTATRKMVLVR